MAGVTITRDPTQNRRLQLNQLLGNARDMIDTAKLTKKEKKPFFEELKKKADQFWANWVFDTKSSEVDWTKALNKLRNWILELGKLLENTVKRKMTAPRRVRKPKVKKERDEKKKDVDPKIKKKDEEKEEGKEEEMKTPKLEDAEKEVLGYSPSFDSESDKRGYLPPDYFQEEQEGIDFGNPPINLPPFVNQPPPIIQPPPENQPPPIIQSPPVNQSSLVKTGQQNHIMAEEAKKKEGIKLQSLEGLDTTLNMLGKSEKRKKGKDGTIYGTDTLASNRFGVLKKPRTYKHDKFDKSGGKVATKGKPIVYVPRTLANIYELPWNPTIASQVQQIRAKQNALLIIICEDCYVKRGSTSELPFKVKELQFVTKSVTISATPSNQMVVSPSGYFSIKCASVRIDHITQAREGEMYFKLEDFYKQFVKGRPTALLIKNIQKGVTHQIGDENRLFTTHSEFVNNKQKWMMIEKVIREGVDLSTPFGTIRKEVMNQLKNLGLVEQKYEKLVGVLIQKKFKTVYHLISKQRENAERAKKGYADMMNADEKKALGDALGRAVEGAAAIHSVQKGGPPVLKEQEPSAKRKKFDDSAPMPQRVDDEIEEDTADF